MLQIFRTMYSTVPRSFQLYGSKSFQGLPVPNWKTVNLNPDDNKAIFTLETGGDGNCLYDSLKWSLNKFLEHKFAEKTEQHYNKDIPKFVPFSSGDIRTTFSNPHGLKFTRTLTTLAETLADEKQRANDKLGGKKDSETAPTFSLLAFPLTEIYGLSSVGVGGATTKYWYTLEEVENQNLAKKNGKPSVKLSEVKWDKTMSQYVLEVLDIKLSTEDRKIAGDQLKERGSRNAFLELYLLELQGRQSDVESHAWGTSASINEFANRLGVNVLTIQNVTSKIQNRNIRRYQFVNVPEGEEGTLFNPDIPTLFIYNIESRHFEAAGFPVPRENGVPVIQPYLDPEDKYDKYLINLIDFWIREENTTEGLSENHTYNNDELQNIYELQFGAYYKSQIAGRVREAPLASVAPAVPKPSASSMSIAKCIGTSVEQTAKDAIFVNVGKNRYCVNGFDRQSQERFKSLMDISIVDYITTNANQILNERMNAYENAAFEKAVVLAKSVLEIV